MQKEIDVLKDAVNYRLETLERGFSRVSRGDLALMGASGAAWSHQRRESEGGEDEYLGEGEFQNQRRNDTRIFVQELKDGSLFEGVDHEQRVGQAVSLKQQPSGKSIPQSFAYDLYNR